MIARTWRGWVHTDKLDEYVRILERTGMSEYRATPGNRGAQLLTRDLGDGRTELITLSWWDDLDVIRAFAGDDIEAAKYYPEDDGFLFERETTVSHFDVGPGWDGARAVTIATTRRDNVLRSLVVLMAVAFAVSVVHYVDNTVNYADYPQVEPGSALPNPSQAVIGSAWFVFTAFGALGLWWFVRGRITAAAVAIAIYSGSGLVGFAHYAVPGAIDMVWWRQVHVIADIICGLLLFAFALWSVFALREET